jgi:hypothetical protein
MRVKSGAGFAVRWATAGVVLCMASWAAYAGMAWIRYGRAKRPTTPEETDLLLDQFMPEYEVADCHQISVDAPVELTFAAATNLDLQQSATIRAIFRARELILGSEQIKAALPPPLLEWAKALGWGVLAEVPGREVVMGAVTRPWEKNVVFRTLPPFEFANFHEPGYVKIAWTLRADRLSASQSIVRTETRVTTTDLLARTKFRRYWAFLSPGILLIRRIALSMVKRTVTVASRRQEAIRERP